jgi:hypothetical protein
MQRTAATDLHSAVSNRAGASAQAHRQTAQLIQTQLQLHINIAMEQMLLCLAGLQACAHAYTAGAKLSVPPRMNAAENIMRGAGAPPAAYATQAVPSKQVCALLGC